MADIETKKCSICGQDKLLSEFYHPPSKANPRSECLICQSNSQRENTYGSAKNYINRSLILAKSRAKKKGWPVDKALTVDFLLDIYHQQRGLCAISSLPMSWNKVQNADSRSKYNGTNISIDRIDSNKPYTTDNVRLVCNEVNRIRSDMDDERLYFWAGAIFNSMQNTTTKN